MNIEEYSNYLVTWIKNTVLKSGAKGVVVGISGGIDSALVVALAKKAFPDNSLGIIMPINKMTRDLKDIQELKDNINIKTYKIDLKPTFIAIKDSLRLRKNVSIFNIKPRLRMTTLYGIAQDNGYLVLGTDNKVEWEIGYFTKHGDGAADLLPINQLLKSEVREMAKILNIPSSIINKTPSAGLWNGQTDEEEFGFSYKEIDGYLSGMPTNKDVIAKIKQLQKQTAHKRQKTPKPLPRNKN